MITPKMRGTFIRERRKYLGLSVDNIAKACGVSCSTIYMWERGERGENFSLDMAVLLAPALKVSLGELAEGEQQGARGAPAATR